MDHLVGVEGEFLLHVVDDDDRRDFVLASGFNSASYESVVEVSDHVGDVAVFSFKISGGCWQLERGAFEGQVLHVKHVHSPRFTAREHCSEACRF